MLVFENRKISESALKVAIELSLSYGAKLTIITSYEVPLEGFAYSPDIWGETKNKAKKNQDYAVEKSRSAGVRTVDPVLVHGKGCTEVMGYAHDLNAGLIVVGCRKRKVVKNSSIVSSIGNYIRHTSCPLWIAKI